MAEFDGVRVRGRRMTGGFAQAMHRWHGASADEDRLRGFWALFEALEWAHALDDYLARVWRPDGAVGEDLWWGWRRHPAISRGDELWNIMRGLRYARNRVHHQWADAVDTRDGLTFPIVFPARFRSWVWRSADDLPAPPEGASDPEGREAYSKALAGRPVNETLTSIAGTFAFLGPLLDPPISERTPPVVEVVAE